AWRVWGCADGGRQHLWRHAHRFDFDLRFRAGAELRRGRRDFAVPAVGFVRRAGGHLRAPAAHLGGMADQLICQCRKRLSKVFEVEADLRIPLDRAPVTVLFGPSGSGKTTLLRMIAGLERPDAGSIVFGERAWFDAARAIHLPPQKRRAGFLFQDYALFPHLTVLQNVAYNASRETARQLLDTFGLAEFAASKPRAISGGQQQRVALARALAAQPALLLLDEPLSALDAATRSRTRYELRRMLLTGGVPSIVVTHDRMEAVALGDWMAVMVDGRIRQTGPVQEVFRRPADPQVAESVGVE